MRFQVPLPRPELRFRVPLTHTPSDTRAQVPLPQRTAKRLQICAVPLWAPTYTYGGARLSMLYAISGFPFVFHKLGNSQSSAVHVRPTFVRPAVNPTKHWLLCILMRCRILSCLRAEGARKNLDLFQWFRRFRCSPSEEGSGSVGLVVVRFCEVPGSVTSIGHDRYTTCLTVTGSAKVPVPLL